MIAAGMQMARPETVVVRVADSPWWQDLLINLGAAVLGGLIVGFVVYLMVERQLHLRDEQRSREAVRRAALRHVLGELRSTAAKHPTWVEALTEDDYGVPFPGFDVTGWAIVSQAAAAVAIKEDTLAVLAQVYNRMGAANQQLALLSDLNHGSTAVLVNASVARLVDNNARVREAYDQYRELRDGTVRGALLERLEEMKPHLHDAIDAVESELGIAAAVPSVQRTYVTEETTKASGAASS